MDNSEKRKVNPRSIDEKAILEIVAGKGSRLSATSDPVPAPSSGPDTAEIIPASPPEQKHISTDGQCAAFIATFLDVPRSASTTTLHIDTDVHRCISSLVWGIGDKKVTVSGVANRILALFFEENAELVHSIIEKHCESFKTK